MFGSLSISRKRSASVMPLSWMGAPAVSSRTSRSSRRVTVRPSIASASCSVLVATRSTTPSATASRSGIDTLSRTALSAQSALRPRCSAMPRM